MSRAIISKRIHSIEKILKWVLVFLSILAIGHWLYLGGRRLLYPYEVSWMEGSMLDQILRLLQGKSLYTVPTLEYVPWLYQPFYYYIAAGVAKLTGLTFVNVRIISVLSTIVSALLIGYVVHKETNKNKFFAIIGVGLFLVAYGKVGYSFESARVDSLFLVLLLIGCVVTLYAKSKSAVFFGALILTLSYFTKQSSVFFFPGIAFLMAFRNRKYAIAFTLSLVFFILCGTILFHIITNGWYEYYTLYIPSAKRKTFQLLSGVSDFFSYVTLRCWLVTIILFILSVISGIFTRTKSYAVSNRSIHDYLFLAALLTAFVGLGNEGGGKNVLMPVAAFTGISLPLIADSMIKRSKKEFSTILYLGLILIQFMMLISNPYAFPQNIPTKNDELRQEAFLDSIRVLPGELWIPYHGYMPHSAGKETFAELRAYGDVLLMNDSTSHHLKYSLDSTLRAHRFTRIFDDQRDTFPGYILKYITPNLHKPIVFTDTMYVYTPE